MSCTRLESCKDALAERGHAGVQAGCRQGAGRAQASLCPAAACPCLCVLTPPMWGLQSRVPQSAPGVCHTRVGTCSTCLGLHAGVCCETPRLGGAFAGQQPQARPSSLEMEVSVLACPTWMWHRACTLCVPWTCVSPMHACAVPCTAPGRSCRSFWGWRDPYGHSEGVLLQQHPL